MAESTTENPLLTYYRRYIGAPDRTVDVYAGFGLFFASVGLIAVGVAVFLYSATLPANEQQTYAIRQVAAISGAIGLPALLASIVVLLPVDKRMVYLSAVGGSICLAAVVLFAWAYPHSWNVTNPPDYSAQGVAIYSLGIVLVITSTGAALVAHRVEQETATAPQSQARETDDAEEETISDEDVRADIDRELGKTELSWGGVEKKKTKRLKLDTTAVDDVDREQFVNSAKETRVQTSSVNDAVSQLQGLQGGKKATASGEGVDNQADALRQLREQQKQKEKEAQEAAKERSLLDRTKNYVDKLR
ncbi:permease [Halorubraceae archaeon YAN]|nr:permease [Halorubraceae archaeon YAN]